MPVDYGILGDIPGAGDGPSNTDPPAVGTSVQDPVGPAPPTIADPAPGATATPPPAADSPPALEATEYENLTPRERALIERLEKITGERLDISKVDTTPEPALPEPSEHNFLDGVDMDDVLSSGENLNKLLLSVYNRALEQSSRLSAENILRNLPQVISQYVTQHMTLQEQVNQFYNDNPELKGVKRTVAAVANEIAAANPELQLQDVFKQSADRVYTMLGLKRGASTNSPPPPRSGPALPRPRGAGGRVAAPQLEGVAAEIDELIRM